MAIKKITGIPEIDGVVNALNKKFGGKSLISMGPKKSLCEIKTVSTGSIYLDCQLGLGGFPENQIIEIFGPPSAGKTSIALQLLREYVKKNGYKRSSLFIDLERTTSLDLIKSMGVNPEKIMFAYPDTAEEAFQIAIDLGNSGQVGMIIFDSIDAAQTEADIKRDIGSSGVGQLSRMLSKVLRNMTKVADNNQTTYVLINQIRHKIGVLYGNPETTSGGNAIPFYSALRLRVSSKPSSSEENTLDMKIKIVKNKFAPGMMKIAQFKFVCGKGVEPFMDLILFAKDRGLLRFAGTAVKLSMPGEEEITMCKGGKNGARNYLIQNPEMYSRIRRACYKISGIEKTEKELKCDEKGTDD